MDLMTRFLAPVVLSLFAIACGGSTPEAQAPASSSESAAPAADSAAATPPAPGDKPAGDGWEGEGEAKGPAGTADAKPNPAAAADQPEEKRTMEVIQKIVKDHRASVRECYDKARKDLPSLQGDMIIHFVLDPEGKVKLAELNQERSTLKAPPVVECAIKVLKSIAFPPSSRGMESTVNYPFNFTPSGPPAR
jgi:hypothetical protein